MLNGDSPNYLAIGIIAALVILGLSILDNILVRSNLSEYSRVLRRVSTIVLTCIAVYMSLSYLDLVSETYYLDIPVISEALQFVRNLR